MALLIGFAIVGHRVWNVHFTLGIDDDCYDSATAAALLTVLGSASELDLETNRVVVLTRQHHGPDSVFAEQVTQLLSASNFSCPFLFYFLLRLLRERKKNMANHLLMPMRWLQ